MKATLTRNLIIVSFYKLTIFFSGLKYFYLNQKIFTFISLQKILLVLVFKVFILSIFVIIETST